jgi:hypothetical protein
MNETPTSQPAAAQNRAGTPAPGFLGALRGAWHFTWKSQMTLKSLAITAVCLLALPLFLFLTTPSQRSWAEENLLFPQRASQPGEEGRPRFLGFFLRELDLHPLQEKTIAHIIATEQDRVNREWVAQAGSDISTNRQAALLRDYRERVNAEIIKLLDDGQYADYQEMQASRAERRWGDRGLFAPQSRVQSWLRWLIEFYFFVILPLNCVRVCGSSVRDELQSNTLRFLLTRPANRARLVLVKYLSQVAWQELLAFVELSLLAAVAALRQVHSSGEVLPLLLAAQILAIPAWCALGLLIGLLSNRAIAVALVYGLVVELGIGRIPTNINVLSLMRHLKVLLARSPELQAVYHWPTSRLWLACLILVCAPVVLVSISALVFTRKEYLHPAEIQR